MKTIQDRKIIAGLNGFGRFGLHFLKYWLDRFDNANFLISYINDDYLSIEKALEIIQTDQAVWFNDYQVSLNGNNLIFVTPSGKELVIEYTTTEKRDIPWRGLPEIVLECSGKYTQNRNCCEYYVTGNTKLVIISATSQTADKTIVYGFNEQEFSKELSIISYGSCTVNAYVPFGNFIHNTFGVVDSDVNVIHNIQIYKLPEFNTLKRQACTLEKSAVRLLPFLNEQNFIVNYTIVPYGGVSIISFRFKLKNASSQDAIVSQLEHSCSEGILKGLYSLVETDTGPEVHNCTRFSCVFIKDAIRLVGDNLYLCAYFDNENSANRYFDLIQYISQLYL